MTDPLTNHILRLNRRREVVAQIKADGQLTKRTIAALWRTTRPAEPARLIRWSIEAARAGQ